MLRSIRVIGVVVATGAALIPGAGTASASGGHGRPIYKQAPATAADSTESGGTCTTPDLPNTAPPEENRPLMWVDPNPTSLVAVWIPGLNSTQCVSKRTVSGAGLASRVAAAIENARAFPTTPLPCPYDDNTAVRLFFTYGSGQDEFVDMTLSGCHELTAPRRASRWVTDRVERALYPAAPPAWQQAVGNPAPKPRTHGTPVLRSSPPSYPPATTRVHGACTVPSEPQPSGARTGNNKNLVWVNKNPRRAVAIWIPGENAQNCQAQRTVESTSWARQVASAIRRAPAFPRGVFCPLDDGSAVHLYIGYPSGQNQYVTVELTGCHAVAAPDRTARRTTPALTRALRSAAPPGWGKYFR